MRFTRLLGVAVAALLAVAGPAHAAVTVQPGESLNSAILATTDGQVILAPGTYTNQVVTASPASPVTVTGPGAVLAGGIRFDGAADITLDGLDVPGLLVIEDWSTNITVRYSDIHGACISIRNMVRNATIRGNRIHDCWTGISLPGRVSPSYVSRDVLITNNVISDMLSDGIQASDVDRLRVEDNVLTRLFADNGVHKDGLQLAGGVTNATIRGNSVSYASQGFFLQDATRNGYYRGNSDITVTDNVAHDIADAIVQSQGVERAVFRQNVFCEARQGYYALWLRQGNTALPDGSRTRPQDTVVDHNVLGSFKADTGVAASVFSENVLGC